MSAYNELYLENSMDTLAEMLDYAVNGKGYDLEEFWHGFFLSKYGIGFGQGNTAYIAGMSGIELAIKVIDDVYNESVTFSQDEYVIDFGSKEYWAGWIMAYYQWYRGESFSAISRQGLTIHKVTDAYILHEADVSKFIIWADNVCNSNGHGENQLKRLRKYWHLSQRELSERSGVTLRMIQLYEQGRNDIKKAQAGQINALAKALGTSVEKLIQ